MGKQVRPKKLEEFLLDPGIMPEGLRRNDA